MNDDTGGIAADFSLLINIVPFPANVCVRHQSAREKKRI
jgi:hypothetical protein